MLECLQSCDDEHSEKRRQTQAKYQHLQFPQNRALCDYECLGLMSTQTGEDLIECMGTRGCMAPSDYSDECASIRQEQVLPFSDIAVLLEGRWKKIFTNSWDLWPCQQTQFFPPGVSEPEPTPWMRSWPNEPDVWRMDLSWAFQPSGAKRFTMFSELYPNARWNYGGTTADPTLRTLAHMWGTTAQENWYVLYSDEDMLLMHVCAYTIEVQSFDALTLVFVKEGHFVSDDMENKIQKTAREILGDKFGTLLRVRGDCALE